MAFLDSIKNLFTKAKDTAFSSLGNLNTALTTTKNSNTYQAPTLNIKSTNAPLIGSGLTPLKSGPMSSYQPTQPQITSNRQTLNESKIVNQPLDVNNMKTTDLAYNDQTFTTNANDILSRTNEGVFGSTTPSPVDTRSNSLTKMMDLINQQGTQAEKTLAYQNEEQLAQKQEQLRATNEKAMRIKREYENQLRTLEKNPEGVFGGVLNTQANNLRRQANQELADIAIEQLAAQGNVDQANTVINQKIAAEFEPIQNQIDSLKNYYSLYQNDLSDSEKMMLDSQIKQQEAQYESQTKNAQYQNQASVYQQMLDNGTMALKDIPQEVLPYMNVSVVNKYTQEQIDPLIEKTKLIDQLISSDGLSGAVGPNWLARLSPSSALTGSKQNFLAGMQQLTSKETIDTLLALKAGGGTLGALSDQERLMLQSSATKLGGLAIVDSNGKITGYNGKESDVRDELVKIQNLTQKAILRADVTPSSKKAEILTNMVVRDHPDYSQDDVKEAVKTLLPQYETKKSFNSAGNASASTIANAIKQVESQGNYNAKGKSGEFGAYQFMPNTWKQWAGEFLGNQNAQPTQQNQDFVAQSKINQLLTQGYNPQQIALIWNGGTPQRKSGVNKYGVKYDSGAYADKVLQTLNA